MALLTPLALALGLLAIPILIMYMLKLRRREVEVSSTLLWQLLLRDREANAPWQRLRRNLLLFLQLLLLAALVLALARPYWQVPAIASGTVVVLLDGSASMNATDGPGGATRFEAARSAVREMIDSLSGDSALALILVGPQPEVLVPASADKEALRQALGAARPSQVGADWHAAMALAAGAVRGGAAADSVMVVVSDGGLPDGLPPLPAEVRYLPVGQSADNLAIAALAVRQAPAGPQLLASVANHGDRDRSVILSLSIDGQLYTAQLLDVPAGGATPLVIENLPARPAVYQAHLSAPASAAATGPLDALALDDMAWAVFQPPSGGRVLLVTSGNLFLEQVFAALSGPLGLEPFRLRAGQPLPAEPFDLYVFDGPAMASAITDTLPAGDLLLINPPSNPLFEVGEPFTNTMPARVAANDPLTQFVDWSGVHLLQANHVALPAWARALVEADGGPLVFAGDTGGRRVAVFTFDLRHSDLPLQVTFPVLMSNLIGYLAPAQAFSAPDGLRPGETLTIRPGSGDSLIVIEDPTGARYAATATEAGVIFAETHALGVYRVLSNQAPLGAFAVNLFDEGESDIRPAGAIRLGRAEVAATEREARGQYEAWPWLAAAAFGLLMVEWWVYHRGATLPAAPGWRGLLQRRRVGER
jgi:Ca-activated chloride channel homolog